MNWTVKAMRLALCALMAAAVTLPAAANTVEDAADFSDLERTALQTAMQAKIGELAREKNEAGRRYKRGVFSKAFKKVDDTTAQGSYHVDTAYDKYMQTERVTVTLKKEGEGWKIAEEKVVDTIEPLIRYFGSRCYPFSSFKYEEFGMTASSGSGHVCEIYNREGLTGFSVAGSDLKYDYQAPDYLEFSTLQSFLLKNRRSELVFDPIRLQVSCDPNSCERLLSETFQGLDRVPFKDRDDSQKPEGRHGLEGVKSDFASWLTRTGREWDDNVKDNAFYGYRLPEDPGRRTYSLQFVHNDDHSIGISYDNMDGYEVEFWVYQNNTNPEALRGTLYGYYTDETLETKTPYEIEMRDDYTDRFYEVVSVKGELDCALEDPEVYKANIDYVITVKQDAERMPFFIANVPTGNSSEDSQRAQFFINSILLEGEEVTWVKTSPASGLLVFPEEIKAGTKIALSMDFSTRGIRKVNHATSLTYRGGWLPFVQFGDFIDVMELTIRTPAEYKTLGIGKRMADKRKGNVRESQWYAEKVVFPSIIFGKYEEMGPEDAVGKKEAEKVLARKPDGTPIPVRVHVDTVSTSQSDNSIRVKQLGPIALQAAASINLYQDISGVEYPYGELNLVNDPAPALYGQAPSSLIYLGSAVFRSAANFGDTGVSKFLKSVTAHEVGHQWWGSAIANKNRRNYWFVESLAEYFSALYLEAFYGKKEYDEQVEEWKRTIQEREQWSSVQNADTLWAGPFQGGARQAAIYNKGPMAFHILRKTFGDEKFFPFLKQFTMELAEKGEIVTRDIQQVAEKALGGVTPDGESYTADLSWFFDQWIRSPYVPQYKFDYDVRRSEDGQWVVEGTIGQRLVVGSQSNMQVVNGKYNRGVGVVTVTTKDGKTYASRILVEGENTQVRLPVPSRPTEVVFNEENELLTLPMAVNKNDW